MLPEHRRLVRSKRTAASGNVIGALSDSVELMAGWVLRWLSAVRMRLGPYRSRASPRRKLPGIRHTIIRYRAQSQADHNSFTAIALCVCHEQSETPQKVCSKKVKIFKACRYLLIPPQFGYRGQGYEKRLAQIQNCRSALRKRGCGCLRCSTSNCCRRHRFSATRRAFGLRTADMIQTRNRTTPPLRLVPGCRRGAKPRDCQPQSPMDGHFAPYRCVG